MRLLLIFLFVCFSSAAAQVKDRNVTLVCEGDSIMVGIATPTSKDLCTLLQERLGADVAKRNVAVSGNRVEDVAKRYSHGVYPQRPRTKDSQALLWINVGVNDIGSGHSGMDTARRILQYARRARRDGFKVIVNTVYVPLTFNDEKAKEVAVLNGELRRGRKSWTYLVDIAAKLEKADKVRMLQADGVHPNDEGAAAIADVACEVLCALPKRTGS